MSGPYATLLESVSDSLVKNMHTRSLLEVILKDSGRVPTVPPHTKSCYWFVVLLWPIYRYHLYALETAGKLNKPPCNGTYGCSILEKLDYLCSLIRLQVLPCYK